MAWISSRRSRGGRLRPAAGGGGRPRTRPELPGRERIRLDFSGYLYLPPGVSGAYLHTLSILICILKISGSMEEDFSGGIFRRQVIGIFPDILRLPFPGAHFPGTSHNNVNIRQYDLYKNGFSGLYANDTVRYTQFCVLKVRQRARQCVKTDRSKEEKAAPLRGAGAARRGAEEEAAAKREAETEME